MIANEPKFKVGDKVRINREKLSEYIKEEKWDKVIQDYSEVTIKDYNSHGLGSVRCYWVKENIFLYPEDCFEKIEEKKVMEPKYRIVIKEFPKNTEEVTINYKFLEKNIACQDAKIDFVEKYGNETVKVKDVTQDIANKYGLISSIYEEWSKWLRDNTEYKEQEIIDESKYVLPEDCDVGKIYVLIYNERREQIFKLSRGGLVGGGGYRFTFNSLYNSQERWREEDCFSIEQFFNETLNPPNITIYEFANEKDFAEWYYNEVKGEIK